ncbi:glycosyltransferase [Salibacter sp.]|uniref:glycosyltransferase n=1 Tax=Salibacter sp. TaxID=2010995 RepID=UPI0028705407|nr:glycosyltransferase [Salibacter sp.]MDR9487984.1 glycosyltransferase [Salibacter sp.]
MRKPLLSIIIPCYNLGRYLEECLESFDNEIKDVEVLILDDGSTDEQTRSVLKEIAQKGYQVFWQENQGVETTRNNLIKKAKGKYILPVDPDNTISNDYIQKGIEILESHDEVGVVYSDVIHFDEEKETRVKLPDLEPGRLLVVNYIDNCAVFRKEIWEKSNGYDQNMPKSGYEDWDMWMNALEQGWSFYHINDFLFRYRLREGSLVQSARSEENHIQNYNYLLEKHKSLFGKYHDQYQYFVGVKIAEFSEGIRENEKNFKKILADTKADYQHTQKELRSAIDDKQAHIENVESEKNKLSEQLKHISNQLKHAMDSLLRTQQRLNQIQSMPLFKFAKELKILLSRFRSNNSMDKSQNFFRKIVVAFSKKSLQVIRRFMAKIFKHIYLALEEARVVIVEAGKGGLAYSEDPYMNWIEQQRPKEDDLLKQRVKSGKWDNPPFMSVVIPVYNPPIKYFKSAIDSVMQQSYENWELILSDDCSTDPKVKKTLEEYRKKDPRIKVVYRKENGHISAASNSALKKAEGDFTVLMDQDDLLSLNALYEVAKVIVDNPNSDLIYTDEDKIDESDHHSFAHFKPDWSPESLLSRNYLGHLTVFRTNIMRKIGGWRVGFEGSQDYDLVLRFTEQTNNVYHIPKVLYHWRVHEESTASSEEAKPYAFMAAQKALTEALERREIPGKVDFLDGFRGYSIRLNVHDDSKKVSIIIPTKDKADVLETCIESIFEKTTYPNFEVIVIDNNSVEQDTFELLKKWQNDEPNRFKTARTEEPFNFSYLMNFGRKNATGEYLVLLNNDTKIISNDWLEGMIEQAQRDEIGVVGAKLLYPNDTIQHAGVVIGLGGAAGHILVGEHREGPGYFNYVNLLNNYSALTAACFMVKTEVFDQLDGFDEQFAVEYNDVDFCLRVMNAGYRNVYVPNVEVYHFESISRGHPHLTKESMNRHKSEIKMLRDRWEKYIENDPHYNPNLSLGAHDFRMKF